MIPYLIVHPEVNKRIDKIQEILRQNNLSFTHPDVFYLEESSKLGVEEAKKIKEFLSLKPFKAKLLTVVIIKAENLTNEAQNTLLKTLEEPLGEVLFIMGVSQEDQLLETILSRSETVYLKDQAEEKNKLLLKKYSQEINTLRSEDTSKRFQYIEKLKDKEEFLFALTVYFRQELLAISQGVDTIPPPRCSGFLKELIQAEKWASQNVNIRAILEYLMLKLPSDKNKVV